METNDLQDLWKNIDSDINLKTPEELNHLLTLKARKTINKFLFIFSIDILISFGLIIFLIITALHRSGDIFYLINNSILGLITLFSLVVSLMSWVKLHNNKFNLSVKDWLEQRIKILSGWLLGKYSKVYIFLIPLLMVMINLSIHVYYENKPFLEVMKNEESIFGLIFGIIAGLVVSYFAIRGIRHYQIKNLEFLKAVYGHL